MQPRSIFSLWLGVPGLLQSGLGVPELGVLVPEAAVVLQNDLDPERWAQRSLVGSFSLRAYGTLRLEGQGPSHCMIVRHM